MYDNAGGQYSYTQIFEVEKMAGRWEKRWLKSVANPELVEFFEDSEFDAAEYAKGFFEQREAIHAPQR